MRKQAFLFAMIVATMLTTACSSGDEPQPKAPIDTTPKGTLTPIYGTVADINGTVYKTVTLGAQTWMAENLRVNKFNDGTPLKNAIKATNWLGSGSEPLYCWLNNDSATNAKPYGAYYNSHVISAATVNNNKNIAPKGWHVATKADWDIFEKFLVENGYALNGSICKSIATKSGTATDKYGWIPNVKANGLGNSLELNNKSGFNAFPNGARDGSTSDTFYKQGVNAFWWISRYPYSSQNLVLVGEDAIPMHTDNMIGSKFGCGIRCVKD